MWCFSCARLSNPLPGSSRDATAGMEPHADGKPVHDKLSGAGMLKDCRFFTKTMKNETTGLSNHGLPLH